VKVALPVVVVTLVGVSVAFPAVTQADAIVRLTDDVADVPANVTDNVDVP